MKPLCPVAILLLLGACTGEYYERKEPVISGQQVRAPQPCPDWHDPLTMNDKNSTLPNFGCADATNLVNMVDDKRDLISPKSDHRSEGEQAAIVVNHMRTMEPADPSTQTSGTGATGGGAN